MKEQGSDLPQTIEQCHAEIIRMESLLNTPIYTPFLKAAEHEAAHQIHRWGREHDSFKEPQEWFWLVGYLAGKALRAHIDRDVAKALHHTISSAAVLCHWHRAIEKAE